MYDALRCTHCNPPGPLAPCFSLLPSPWLGVEILRDGQPIYSFPFDQHFHLNADQVTLALSCIDVFDRFWRAPGAAIGQFTTTAGAEITWFPGFFRRNGVWVDAPYIESRVGFGSRDVVLRLGALKTRAIIVLVPELTSWLLEEPTTPSPFAQRSQVPSRSPSGKEQTHPLFR